MRGTIIENKKQLKNWVADVRSTVGCQAKECVCTSNLLDLHHPTFRNIEQKAISVFMNDGISFEELKVKIRECVVLHRSCHMILHGKKNPITIMPLKKTKKGPSLDILSYFDFLKNQ